MSQAALSARARVLTCTSCSLRATCRSPVPWHGPAPHPVVVIGEAPGETEDTRGIPFCGRAGKLLDHLWRQQSLPTPTLLNVVSCRPPDNRTPTVDEQVACRPNLLAQLNAIAPSFVLLLGGIALGSMRPGGQRGPGGAGPRVEIGEWRGRPWWRDGTKYLATYDPAYALRTPDAMKVIGSDLLRFRAIISGWWPETCDCGAEVEFYTDDGIPKCSTSCVGRMCAKCRKPAVWEVVVDGKRWLMCGKHKGELEHYVGVEVKVA